MSAILPALLLTAATAMPSTALAPLRQAMRDAGFAISAPAPQAKPFTIDEAVQDWKQPTPDLCCHTLTPLRIGTRTFAKGIGAHANGRIVVSLNQPFRRFTAAVGVDNNADTQGKRGSVQFVLKVDGAERVHTPICLGGAEPRPVSADLTGAKRLELLVTDAGDGYSYDQADWGDAVLESADGKRFFLGDALSAEKENPFLKSLPTAFEVDGRSCWDAFAGWKREALPTTAVDGGSRYTVRWTDPKTAFAAELAITLFDDTPAAELRWRFANPSAAPGPLITRLDSIALQAPSAARRATFLSSAGGLTGSFDNTPERLGFALTTTTLGEKRLTVEGGRSSNGDLPFFALREGTSGWGIAAGLGWSGQWAATARYDEGQRAVSLRAGMEPVHFRLDPGETVTLPSALLAPFRGSETEGAALLRRVLRAHYQPRLDGKPVLPPVSFNSWFVFGNGVNAKLLCDLADAAAPLGIEYFCLDSGWFDGDFPGGVGNWTIQRTKFPEGLKPVADHVHALGMKFGVWFEPERVAAGTRWAREHPELVTGDLLDLGRPEARALVLDLLDRVIRENGVDWIRYDFNTDPLRAWSRLEDADHQGLRQVRHINGFYAVLDELMHRHPGLLIEQCASGGRRIDLETIRRGHTIWKSDNTTDQALMHFHETGANCFLPASLLNTNLCRVDAPGEMLALFAGPLGFGADFRQLTPAQRETVRHTIAAYKQVRRFLDDDYTPLFPQSTADQGWNGWQFLDPRAGEGFFALYRQPASPYPSAEVRLTGLDAGSRYQLEELLTGKHLSLDGKRLGEGYALSLKPGAGQVWHFARVGAKR